MNPCLQTLEKVSSPQIVFILQSRHSILLKSCIFLKMCICRKNFFNQPNKHPPKKWCREQTFDNFYTITSHQSANISADVCHLLSLALTQSQRWCKRADGNALGVCRQEKNKQTKKQESDEYAFHYCCNVVTTLMRSMESWTSHFVVSPIHSLVQKIRCGIVLRHIHSDGWMLMFMFQTTGHHSQHHVYLFIFYGLLRNTPESCDGSTFVIPLWFMQWKCMFQGKRVRVKCFYNHFCFFV